VVDLHRLLEQLCFVDAASDLESLGMISNRDVFGASNDRSLGYLLDRT